MIRLRRLDLLRYGGWEGRSLDFGDGRPDLHLIVGRNEAGKSTLLSAIGDLLFGFPSRTTQDWRFDSKDLRLAATLEHPGGTFAFVRRKGLKNTLLGPAGAAMDDAGLDALLGGLDRQGFERLFGLDHARLRKGGEAILKGQDDAAQSLFEVETGVSAVAERVRRLETECADLFKPNASNPTINRLLRERQQALEAVRNATLSETDWKGMKERQAVAAARRDELIAEDEALSIRAAGLERLARVRTPLRRLAQAREDLAALQRLPAVRLDAAERLAAARAERATCRELETGHLRKRDQAREAARAIVHSEPLLAQAARIEELEERRAEIERMRQDMPRKAAELDLLDARLKAARDACGLPPAESAPWPSPAWRRRARRHLDDSRALADRARTWRENTRIAERDQRDAAEALAALPPSASASDLQEALAALGPDVLQRVEASADAAARAERRAAEAFAALAFSGPADELARARLPSYADAVDHDAVLRRAEANLLEARQAADAAQADARRHRVRMEGLAAGGDLPTPAVIASSRQARDEALESVRARLTTGRQADDGAVVDRLATMITEADRLADARDAAAAKVAEYGLAAADLALAEVELERANAAIERAEADGKLADSLWSERLARSRLPPDLRPAGFSAWAGERERWLGLREEARASADGHRRDRAAVGAADVRLTRVLEHCGGRIDGALEDRLREARALAARLQEASNTRTTVIARVEASALGAKALHEECASIDLERQRLETERVELLAEGRIGGGRLRLEDVLEALDAIGLDMGARPGLHRDVEGMRRDIGEFDSATAAVLGALEQDPARVGSEIVRRLVADLAEARRRSAERRRLVGIETEETEALETVGVRLGLAQAQIDELMAAAGAATEAELDRVLEEIARRSDALSREAHALNELDAERGDASIEDLTRAAADTGDAEAAAERNAIDGRRGEITVERERLAGELAHVRSAIEAAGLETKAADANQALVEVRASLAASAERYIEAAASAALLRWLVERRRATARAPLLERAGALFQTVTAGAFEGLALDYDDEDHARIVCARADGDRLGVEALSEGTRDQLFLALRLGSLQTRPRGGALPLICDDLLITSDDDRTTAILRVLGEAAERSQVLVFSHHDHVVDLARRELGAERFRLHRIEPQTA